MTYKIIVDRFYRPKDNFNQMENDITRKILLALCQIRKKYKQIPPKTDRLIKNILSDNLHRLLLDVYRGLLLNEKQEKVIFEKDYFK